LYTAIVACTSPRTFKSVQASTGEADGLVACPIFLNTLFASTLEFTCTVNATATSPIETVPSTQVIVLPLTVPAGPDTNDTVEAIKPVGKTSVIITEDAALPPTCNVKSYRTTSPAFGFSGKPVFNKLITAMGVGVEVEVAVMVAV
jgi:hypothetical protein